MNELVPVHCVDCGVLGYALPGPDVIRIGREHAAQHPPIESFRPERSEA